MDIDRLYEKLDQDGEVAVRRKLASHVYGSKKIPHVNNWLLQKDRERQEELRYANQATAAVNDKVSWFDKIIDNIKTHPVASLLVFVSVIIIGIGSTASALDNTIGFVNKYWSVDLSERDVHILVDYINDPNNSSEDRYNRLLDYFSAHKLNAGLITDAQKWEQTLYAIMMGNVALISTNGQYKLPSFLVFIDSKKNKIILSDKEIGAGITGVKVVKNEVNPSYIVIFKYITITGTGTFAESTRLFIVDEDLVLMSLDKPYREVNSGWGLFVSETVVFETKDDFLVNDGNLEIHSSGIVFLEDEKKYRELPKSIYKWNYLSKQFEQTQGRMTHAESLMTSIYSDFADPKGDWFNAPRALNQANINSIFNSEEW